MTRSMELLCPSILQRFAHVTTEFSAANAITFLPTGDAENAESLTYCDLKKNAERVASALLQRAQAGDRVMLLVPAGTQFFSAVWGCLLAGVVIVPVAIPQTDAQFEFTQKILSDCRATVIFTQNHLLPALSETLAKAATDIDWLTLEQALVTEKTQEFGDHNLKSPALLQYTSGSTGMPKGVVVTYGNLSASIDLMLKVAAIDEQAIVVSWLPLFHNMGFISFGLLPLSVGSRLVLMPTESFMLNPARWFRAISHFGGTHSGAPNIGYESCLNFLPDAVLEQLDLASWQVAAIGSEPLKSNLIDRFTQRFARCGFRDNTFLTTYGFSEATVFSAGSNHHSIVSRLEVDKDAFESGLIQPVQGAGKILVSVGVAREHIAIVNPDSFQRCGDRELGEIWVRGATVAEGYWQQPAISSETFGLLAADGSGPYVRSGDMGLVADGDLYVVGRRKELIIVGSKKLHPLDIEQVVNGANTSFVPYATAASAWQHHDDETLALFQELKPDADPALYDAIVMAICDVVYERFSVQVGRIILLRAGSLPRTHNGKLQRIRCCERVDNGSLSHAVLLDWQLHHQAMKSSCSAEENAPLDSEILTPTQSSLVQLWQALLNRSTVSIDADFVSLGGQSIIATRIVAQLRSLFAGDFTIRTLFRYPTIRLLSRYVDTQIKTNSAVPSFDIPSVIATADGWLPVSSAQQRLWLLNQFDKTSAAYHMCASYRMTGELNVDALAFALSALVTRHSMLRTIYRTSDDGITQQKPLPDVDFNLALHDLAGISTAAERHEKSEALLQQSRTLPFDLSCDLMLRACVIRIDANTHILSMTVHHIAADGWSVGILVNELATLYANYISGNASDTIGGKNHEQTALQWHYAEWMHHHELTISASRYSDSIDYWSHQLQNLPNVHSLPLDHTRKSSTGFQGKSCYSRIPRNVCDALNEAARAQGVTLYMQLQTALAILIARLSSVQDIAIGAAYANRDHPNCETIVGFFVNTLVIRHTLEPDACITSLLQQCKTSVLDAYDNGDLPFDHLVEKLNPRRNGYVNPLFQIMLNLQTKDTWDLELPGLTTEPFQVRTQETKFDLAVDCTQSDDEISIQWEFDSHLFDISTIERWAGYFERILQTIAFSANENWERILLLPAAEQEQLLYSFNDTDQPVFDVCIHQLFEQQAQAQPDALALVCGEASLSYFTLNQRANQIAHGLLAFGITPDDRVAIVIERSVDSVLAMLAVLKSGAAYVPVDPSYPQQRIDYILHDVQPSVVITQSVLHDGLVESLQDKDCVVVTLEQLQTDNIQNPHTVCVKPCHLAYIIYTSGSTGQPKGAMLEHRQIANLICNDQYAPLTIHDRVAHCANPAFDAATWEIWSTLTHGARLVVIPSALVLQPSAFAYELQSQQITAMVMTVALFNQYREYLAPVLSQLHYCLIGGEAVDVRAAMATLKSSAPRHLVNIYGPTEAAVFVATHDIQLDSATCGTIPIGRPVANTKIYILDRFGNPVPTGVTGELHVAGEQVARGYWNRPELNAERFLENPFAAKDTVISGHERAYKTGDMARWRADGVLEYVGRNDHQIKVRGFRVELHEIGQALAEISGVREAVVCAQHDGHFNDSSDTILIAYVVPEKKNDLNANAWFGDLKTQLATRLPDYMLPMGWILLDAVPLTAHGKLDRAALSKQNPVSAQIRDHHTAYQAPINAQESMLAQAWQETLNISQAGRADNFFAQGGHSLLAVRLSERLRKKGIHLDVRSIFAAATLADMATLMQQSKGPTLHDIPPNKILPGTIKLTPDLLPLLTINQAQIDSIVAEVTGGARNIQDIYPLSPLQEGILFHHLMTPVQDPYLLHSVVAFDNRSILDSFLEALRRIIDRHDILRTSIHWNGLERPVQVVNRVAPLSVSEHAECSEETAIDQLLMRIDQSRDHFEMTGAPLITASVMQDTTHQRWLLGILAHHIIADHQTLELVFAEIVQAMRGNESLLPASIPFRNHIARQQSKPTHIHEAYFRELLGSYEEPAFIFGIAQQSVDRGQIHYLTHTIKGDVLTALQQQSRLLQVTTASILHVAWAMVMGACSGRNDVVLGTVLSGLTTRESEDERSPGMFINTLPVRFQISRFAVADSIKSAHRQLTALTSHEHAPLALAKRCSAVSPNTPLFNVLLNYRHKQGAAEQELTAALAAEGIHMLNMEERTHYPFTLCIDESEIDLVLALQSTSTTNNERLLRYFETTLDHLLQTLAADATTALAHISVIPQNEHDQLVTHFNKTVNPLGESEFVHRQFEKKTTSNPDAIALTFNGTNTTYQQLNARANQIAHQLLGFGVQPDDRIAVCIERSPDLVAALIGVLKVGAGYVPLDPMQPDTRLEYALRDCQPRVLLTTSNLCESLSKYDIPLLQIDNIDNVPSSNIIITGLTPSHLAYIIYTSGSTGQPKGVQIEHQQLTQLFSGTHGLFDFNSDDVWTLFHSCAFDFSVWEMWGALIHGARLVIVPANIARISDEFYQLVCEEKVTILNQTPGALRSFLSAQEGAGSLPSLRYVILGGENVDPHLVHYWNQLNATHATRLINMYGITEITVHGTFCDITGRDPGMLENDGGLIGSPLPGTRIYVLDSNLRPAPIGVTGEIYVGGHQIARGYWQRDDLNGQRFITDPFNTGNSARLYRTGDLGRWCKHGTLDYCGRNDAQVKIRGYRIELSEVEFQLRGITGICEALVLPYGDTPNGRLIAYVVMEPSTDFDLNTTRQALASRLPEYMLPASYISLPAFPLNHNGKIDKNALPSPNQACTSQQLEKPVGNTECRLAQIWQSLLGIPMPGRHDHFFDQGGDSLLAVQLNNAIQREWGINLPLRTVFELATISKLASVIQMLHSPKTTNEEQHSEEEFEEGTLN